MSDTSDKKLIAAVQAGCRVRTGACSYPNCVGCSIPSVVKAAINAYGEATPRKSTIAKRLGYGETL